MDEKEFHLVFMHKEENGGLVSDFERLLQRIMGKWRLLSKEYFSSSTPPRWNRDKKGYETTKFLEFLLGDYNEKKTPLQKKGTIDEVETIDEVNERINKTVRLIMITSRIRIRTHLHVKAKKELSRADLETIRKDDELPLYWLIEQWHKQDEGIYLTDSLTKALVNGKYPSRYIAFAQLSHARRMRIGVGRQGLEESLKQDRAKYERIKISEDSRLLDSAEKLLREDKADHGNFSFMPSRHFEIYLQGQRMLTKSRIGSQKEVVKIAEKVISDLEEISDDDKNHEFEWHKHLLWYAYFSMVRAASAANDGVSFKDYTEKIRSLEKNVESTRLKGYYEGQQRDRLKLRSPQTEESPWRWPDDQKLYLCMRIWANFIASDLDVDIANQGRRNIPTKKMAGRRKLKKMNNWLNSDPPDVYGIFPVIHAIAAGRANRDEMDKRESQKFVIGETSKAERRIAELLTEIEWTRFEVRANPTPLSTAILEILCREVIYRMWFEAAKLPESFNLRIKWGGTKVRAISLLKAIKKDIRELRPPSYRSGKSSDFITNSIKELERARNDDSDSNGFIELLREIIKNNGYAKTNFTGKEPNDYTDIDRKKQHYFLGMPMGVEDQDLTEFQHMFLPRLEYHHH